MSVPFKHIFQQGANLRTLGKVGLAALGGASSDSLPELPGPVIEVELEPRPEQLLHDFIRWSGGDPRSYAGTVPPSFMPQWGFPLLGPTLDGLPYPLSKVLNQGCRLTVNAPIPVGVPMRVSAQLAGIEVQPHKARIHQRLVTGTADEPEALIADIYAHVPLDGPRPEGGKGRGKPSVPADSLELHRLRFRKGSGWEFGLLTGDFNPIHWLGPYAKVAGFKGVIMQGFASLACSLESVVQHRWSGDPFRLHQIDVRFTKPVPQTSTPGVFLGHEPDETGAIPLALGEDPGGRAYMLGSVRTRPRTPSETAPEAANTEVSS